MQSTHDLSGIDLSDRRSYMRTAEIVMKVPSLLEKHGSRTTKATTKDQGPNKKAAPFLGPQFKRGEGNGG